MKAMTNDERKEAIKSLKVICKEIGCSGLTPSLCDERPHCCEIIRKLVAPPKKAVEISTEAS